MENHTISKKSKTLTRMLDKKLTKNQNCCKNRKFVSKIRILVKNFKISKSSQNLVKNQKFNRIFSKSLTENQTLS